MSEYELIILDVDGTLVDGPDSHEFLPGVIEKLSSIKGCDFALASNQGGVGLRFWMERDGFGDPAKYPTEVDAARRIRNIANRLMLRLNCWCYYYVSFAYQSKKSGNWGPTPDGREDDPRWSWSWRKPDTGMLQQAAKDTGVPKRKILMVGDRPEDEEAARTFECDFLWANDFFGRSS